MRGAYKWDKSLSWVEDCRFDLATRGNRNHDVLVQYTLRTLAYASGPVSIEALERFDPTEPSFIRYISGSVYQNDEPFQIEKTMLFFLVSVKEGSTPIQS